MTDPVDWYTAGKLIWTIQDRASNHSVGQSIWPERILVHPGDRYRLMHRLPGDMGLTWDGKNLLGIPIEIQHSQPEHKCDLVYPGWEWVPVVFDPIDFEEPWPTQIYPDGTELARNQHRWRH